MKKISILDRIFLLLTGFMAAYHIVVGMNGLKPQIIWFYTTGFGILLVAGLLLIILGFEGLESQAVVIISTLIPLSLSLGLISEYLTRFTLPYLFFSITGLGAVAITRYTVKGSVTPGFCLVSLGGGLIGIGGLFLAFLKAGKPILSQDSIYSALPVILFLMTATFIGGFSFQ